MFKKMWDTYSNIILWKRLVIFKTRNLCPDTFFIKVSKKTTKYLYEGGKNNEFCTSNEK